jgi:RNA polymerase sigma-70 factor (sigma-E family)
VGVDQDHFEAVFDAEHEPLIRFAGLLAADAAKGEDLAAEALARFVVASRRKVITEPGPYLRRTVVNLVIGTARRNRVARRHAHQLDHPSPPVADAEDTLAERDRLWDALRALPVRSRAIVVLRFYLDLSVDQVADLLRMAPGTVKSTSARSLEQLRATLEEEADA